MALADNHIEREDPPSRVSTIQFILLICIQFLNAVVQGVLGPVLPDLMCIMEADLKSVSTIFLSYWLGQTCICLLGIFLQDKLDLTLTMTISLVVQAMMLAPVPLVKDLPVTDFMFLIIGGCRGLCKIGTYVQMRTVCQTNNSGYHAISASSGLGFVISPLLASLFVNQKQTLGYVNKNGTLTTDVKYSCNEFSTNIEYIFLIFSLLSLSLAVGFAINYPKLLNTSYTLQEGQFEGIPDLENMTRQLLVFKVLLLCLLATLSLVNTSVTALMVTYGIRSNLRLNVNTATLLSSVFSLGVFVSRMISASFANRVRPDRVFWCYLLLCLCTAVYFVVYKASSTTELFLVCVLFGIGIGPHLACVQTWSMPYVPFTVRFLSLYSMVTGIGGLLVPSLQGMLMDLYGPDMFVYTTCPIFFCKLLLFSVIWNLAGKIKPIST